MGIVVLAWMINFIQGLFEPYSLPKVQASANNNFSAAYRKDYLWDGKFNINLAVRTRTVSLLNYNPWEETITVIDIPDETFLEIPPDLGKWQLRALHELGELGGLGGGLLLKSALTSFFGVPLDGFLDFGNSEVISANEVVESLRKNIFSGYDLLSGIKTDLSMWELIRLKKGISSVRFDKIRKLDLRKLDVLQKEVLADGTPVFTADLQVLDSVLSDLKDPSFVSEHKTIAILNATDKGQLAQKWARLVTNLGGNVIILGNADERLQKTKIWGEQSQTYTRLRQIFAPDDKIGPSEKNMASTRAQITILLGEDAVTR